MHFSIWHNNFFCAIIRGGNKLIMAIKLMLLKTGETIITDAKEVVQEEQTRGYLLNNPQTVTTQEKTVLMEDDTLNNNYELDVILRSWMLLSADKEFVITTDIVATICDPLPSVLEMYEAKVAAANTEVTQTEVV
tara:strand:- start:268 stop:672 length:405 start_codon:yes stop_codon:yes gene_type:complete